MSFSIYGHEPHSSDDEPKSEKHVSKNEKGFHKVSKLKELVKNKCSCERVLRKERKVAAESFET